MSNTTKVTPYEYENDSSGLVEVGTACIVALTAGTVALVRWLLEETPEDRAAVDRLKEEKRRERLVRPAAGDLSGSDTPPLYLTTVRLHTSSTESLVRSAEKLGYRASELPGMQGDQSRILLSRTSGERLAIERNAKGRLTIRTTGDEPRIQAIVRQHTLDCALEHLKSKGMDIQTAELSSGAVQIHAREKHSVRSDGTAEIRTQINTDGTLWVDVDKIRGSRCGEIVDDLADAVGGQVSVVKKKDSYYQLPGEPAKIRTRI